MMAWGVWRWKGQGRAVLLAFGLPVLPTGVASISAAIDTPPPEPVGIVQAALLDPSKPLFVPTHPRVATTVRFPGPIGAPEGRGFTEDEARAPGEYLVTWTPGDAHLTLTPLAGAGPANLNIPYQGVTYVLYFYPCGNQFQALASLNLIQEPQSSSSGGPGRIGGNQILPGGPAPVAGSPGRWLGFLDKLKVLRAAGPGAATAKLAEGFGLDCWEPPRGDARAVQDHGTFRIRLLRVARDARLNCIGFALRLENASGREIGLDVSSFAARVGGIRLVQSASDAPGRIAPGGTAEAFFVAQCPKLARLLPENPWEVSVALVGHRFNPCAAMVGGFVAGWGEEKGALP